MIYRNNFIYEYKKVFSGRNIIIFFLLFLLVSAFGWEGINDYKIILESKNTFQEMEKEKISKYVHINFYGLRGIRIFFLASPMSIFFKNTSIINNIIATINTSDGLEINKQTKGKELFDQSNNYTDFAGLALLIGGLFGLLYGFLTTNNNQFLKFLNDIIDGKKIIISIIFPRIIILVLGVLLFLGLSVLWVFILGFNILNIHLFTYSLELILNIAIFFLIGALCGFLKAKIKKFLFPIAIFFILMFFTPWIVNKVVYINAGKIQSLYKFQYEKFKLMMELENRLYKKFGVWKDNKPAPEEIQNEVRKSLEIEHKDIRELEEKRFNKIFRRVKMYQMIASFFPTTLYISVNREISSNGFLGYIDFYK